MWSKILKTLDRFLTNQAMVLKLKNECSAGRQYCKNCDKTLEFKEIEVMITWSDTGSILQNLKHRNCSRAFLD